MISAEGCRPSFLQTRYFSLQKSEPRLTLERGSGFLGATIQHHEDRTNSTRANPLIVLTVCKNGRGPGPIRGKPTKPTTMRKSALQLAAIETFWIRILFVTIILSLCGSVALALFGQIVLSVIGWIIMFASIFMAKVRIVDRDNLLKLSKFYGE